MFLANVQKILDKLSYFLEKNLSLCEFSSNAFGEPYISFVLLYSCSMWFNVIQQHYRYKVFLQKGHQKFTYEQTKRSYNIVTPWFLAWTSLGLNQGPPDYEAIWCIFHEIVNNIKCLKINKLYYFFIPRNILTLQQFLFRKFTKSSRMISWIPC